MMPLSILQSYGFKLLASSFIKTSPLPGVGTGTSTCCMQRTKDFKLSAARAPRSHNQNGLIAARPVKHWNRGKEGNIIGTFKAAAPPP